MSKIKNNRKGFSLVELLAVVVILGLLAAIGIVATNSLIDRSKAEKMDSQKNTVTMSAQTYMQNNKNLVPKIIGETSVIKVSDLRASKYLTEDIKNEKGESCMEKSYVRVYKLSNTEYTYTTFLYCGSEEVPADEVVPSPVITAKFSDSSGMVKDDLLNNVSDAYLYIEISAATTDEIASYKSQGTQIAIDGYSFKIFVYKGSTRQEAYNSGSLSGGREEKIIINKKLQDYIDVTGVTEVSIEVTAINTIGGITNTNTTIGEHDEETEKTTYDDNVKPKCVKPDSPYTEGDWLNKNEYNASKDERKLTVGCNDGTGSGCIRNYFTMSWPNDDDKYGAEFVYIEVKDNAGNISEHNDECKFRVNVDIKTPEATVTAYAGKSSSSNNTNTLATKLSGSNILKKTVKVNDSSPTTKIEPTTSYYELLVGHGTDDKWMNNANFSNGVIYKIELKDNIRLDKWTWNTNAGYISSKKASNYLKVSSSNPEATSGSVPQDEAHGKTEIHGSTKDTIYVRFLTEGMRYGVFTAYDKAGNKIEIKIAAHLDRTAPPVPSKLNAYVFNKAREAGTSATSTSYSFKTWTNRYVRVETAAGQNRDDLTEGVTLSGFWQFYYDARNHKGNSVGSGDYSTYTSGIGRYDFKGSASQVDGKNKISFKGCDRAGNCSDYGSYKEPWIDITIPVCDVVKTISGTESDQLWLGIGETARVTAYCSDPTTAVASGCTVGNFYHDYPTTINTHTAGAAGNGKGGSFTDHAGNSIDCAANQRVQIDHIAPKCSVSGGNSAWTNKSRTVVGTCSDTGGSGCRGNISYKYTTNTATESAGPAGVGKGGSVGDRADNYVPCAANQPVYVDVVKPYVEWSPEESYHELDRSGQIPVRATCKDAFSGFEPKHMTYYGSGAPIPTTSSGNTHEKCCTDKAGNSYCEKKTYYIKHIHEDSSCGVKLYKQCRTSGCGVELYKECRTKDCGVSSYNKCRSSSCGVDYYTWHCCNNLAGSYCFTKNSLSHPYGGHGYCGKTGTVYKSCRSSSCGVASYKSCRDDSCGVERYKLCRHSQCGVEEYKTCYHYRPCDKLS